MRFSTIITALALCATSTTACSAANPVDPSPQAGQLSPHMTPHMTQPSDRTPSADDATTPPETVLLDTAPPDTTPTAPPTTAPTTLPMLTVPTTSHTPPPTTSPNASPSGSASPTPAPTPGLPAELPSELSEILAGKTVRVMHMGTPMWAKTLCTAFGGMVDAANLHGVTQSDPIPILATAHADTYEQMARATAAAAETLSHTTPPGFAGGDALNQRLIAWLETAAPIYRDGAERLRTAPIATLDDLRYRVALIEARVETRAGRFTDLLGPLNPELERAMEMWPVCDFMLG